MPEKRSHLFTNFIVRAIVGMALIFFVNEFLGYLVLWNFVKVAQNLTFFKIGMDKAAGEGYNRPTSYIL